MKTVERQQTRRQTYALVTMGMITVFGVVAIFMIMGAMRKQTHKSYEDPVVALRDIFARHETKYHMTHGRYATFEELVKEDSISPEVLQGPVQGFLYKLASISKDHFLITADPMGDPPKVEPLPDGRPGRVVPRHHYTVDETHTVRGDPVAITSMSPVLWSPRDSMGR